jgi:hypothetical protein
LTIRSIQLYDSTPDRDGRSWMVEKQRGDGTRWITILFVHPKPRDGDEDDMLVIRTRNGLGLAPAHPYSLLEIEKIAHAADPNASEEFFRL